MSKQEDFDKAYQELIARQVEPFEKLEEEDGPVADKKLSAIIDTSR